MEIFKTQARGAVLYGAELWGHCSVGKLTRVENNFMCQIIGLPRSSPLVLLRMDLGIRPLADEVALRPLLFWHRLWATPELSEYREELRDSGFGY